MRNILLASIVTALASASYQAGAEKIAIVGGTVYTMTSQTAMKNTTVLINNDKITAVGQQLDIPDSYRVINANGKVVTPGFMGAYTALGLVEVDLSAGTVDASVKDANYSAALDVSYAVNPDSSLIDITRIEGFTHAATAMQYGAKLFYGQGAVISLGDEANLVTKAKAFMALDVTNNGADANGGSRAALWVKLVSALTEASYVTDNMKNQMLAPSAEWHGEWSKADLNALAPVVTGKMPLLVKADRASDIRQILALKKQFKNLNITLVGADEAWRVAEELAAASISVILSPESNLPYSFESLGATQATAGRLEKAGVAVAIGIDTHNIRLAPQSAANAVANGLSWHGALASLTTVPAKIYGIDNEVGTIESGKRANLVVWSGDPLEVMEAAEHVIINGKAIEMSSRQTKLRDRYLKLNVDKTHQYIKPN
ncbi:amidohydrolase family protein [Flocculibacter collagenilyticus]|uniref:amidohydrolase family protein n=1 Tax=Flocculibacter collagenilyticus TaxID=2744479 RepID=UPI0018F33F48|nr:amidohydrolase family protein [Flocculibacter collagenilyticus]